MDLSLPKRILIVEDEEPVAKALQLKLNRSGFSSEIAADGEQALQVLEQENFDLILLDLILPQKSGFELLQELKDKESSVPAIIISNLGQEEDRKRAMELGAAGYFVKSDTQLSELVKHVARILK